MAGGGGGCGGRHHSCCGEFNEVLLTLRLLPVCRTQAMVTGCIILGLGLPGGNLPGLTLHVAALQVRFNHL